MSEMPAQEIQVLNSTTGNPIENVAIYNKEHNKSTITTESGHASLEMFSEGDSVYFQHTAFLPYADSYKNLLSDDLVLLTRKVIIMPEFVITASKYRETQRDIPHMVDVITPTKLRSLTSQNSADILTSTGNIFVQKSQGGGGSPVLRGFEANKILLVVDGVRMNNAIYRSGHLQNSLTIDNSILEKTEIVYGPNAIMYGSDALGGVIHYITRDPELSRDSAIELSANAYTQAALANQSYKLHFDYNVGSRKFGMLGSITYGDYGDIRMGTRRDPFLDDFGKDFYYVTQINGIDSLVRNPNPNVQKQTGYSQMDILQKFRYMPSSRLDFIANIQYSSSSEIPRYDQLNSLDDDGMPKYAEWSYGPQQRIFTSLKSTFKDENFFFNTLTATAAYQHIVESRITRRFHAVIENTQKEKVDVISLNLDAVKLLKKNNHLIYGVEVNTNLVESDAWMDMFGQRQPAATRYPDDHNQTASYNAYFSLKSRLTPKLISTIGARYNYTLLESAYSERVDFIPYKTLNIENSSFTGSLGLVGQPSDRLKLSLLLSTGYRIPNLDDLAKVRVKGDQITFPNPYVKPEYTYNIEAGISKTFDGYIQLNGSYFVTWITNVIVRVPYYFENGSDTMWYDGEYLEAYVNDNSDEGIIHGFSLNMISDLNSNISFRSTLNYTYGRNITTDEPLAHIPPLFGKTDFIYETKRFLHQISFEYSGWKKIEDMATTGEDNEDQGTKYGFPGWYTLGLRSTFRLNKHVSIQAAVENVTDNFYKPFATAIAAPGINIIGTLRVHI